MRAFEIENSREFMNDLFLKDRFDDLMLVEADIVSAVRVRVDGRYNTAFFDEDTKPDGEFVRYADEREFLKTLIKGDRAPLSVKIILFHPATQDSVIEGGFINIVFSEGKAKITSAVSYRVFSTDRTKDRSWDEYVEKKLSSYI